MESATHPLLLEKDASGELADESYWPELTQGDRLRTLTDESCFVGKKAAVVLYSYYSEDPRPRREAEALARQGMEVDVVCLRRSSQFAAREAISGVNVFRVPMSRRRDSRFQYVLQYAAFFAAAFSILSLRHMKRRYDLVHVHNMPDFLVFTGLLPRLSGAKLILDLHDPMPEVFQSMFCCSSEALVIEFLKRIEKLSIAFAHQVLTPNLAFARVFASRSCPPEKIHIVMNSPEERVFRYEREYQPPQWDGKRTFDLIYHGLLAERQGVDVAVEAVHKLRNRIPGLKLHVYGEPTPYLTQVMGVVKRLGVESLVEYHGFKSYCEIPEVISAADLGLIPNRLSAFTRLNMPTRIFEYLARNRPAIVSRTQGVQDYFKEDELIFSEPGNAEDLATKIEWFFLHPSEARAILARGRKVYSNHQWGSEEQSFMDVTRRLLHSTV